MALAHTLGEAGLLQLQRLTHKGSHYKEEERTPRPEPHISADILKLHRLSLPNFVMPRIGWCLLSLDCTKDDRRKRGGGVVQGWAFRSTKPWS